MASTFIKYKDRHVQVPESVVTIVAYMLFHEGAVNATDTKDHARFEHMARDFDKRTVGTGCTNLGMDELLAGDAHKVAEFLSLVKLVRKRAAHSNSVLSAEYVSQFMPIREYRTELQFGRWFYWVLAVIEALVGDLPLPARPR